MPEFWKFTEEDGKELHVNKKVNILGIADGDKCTFIFWDGGDEPLIVREPIEEVLRIVCSDAEIPAETESKYKDYWEFEGGDGASLQLVPKSWEVDTIAALFNLENPNTPHTVAEFYEPKTKKSIKLKIYQTPEEVKRIVGWKGE